MVMKNFAETFLMKIQAPKARAFYAFQIFMENVHSETNSLLIHNYYRDSAERNQLLQAIVNNIAVKKKAEWGVEYVREENLSFPKRPSVLLSRNDIFLWVIRDTILA